MTQAESDRHVPFMRLALRLARRGIGRTSPNPMVGAVLVKAGRVIGQGWHRRAGGPHAEIEAITDAARRGHSSRGATLYVTLEPCGTHGRTPPCTNAILAAGIKRVVVGATDPNPKHAGRGLRWLQRKGVTVVAGVAGEESLRLNEAFNHWIVRRTPFVTVKAAMTLDGKIATESGESKWITGERARAEGMKLRRAADAILVGVNTVLTDDPSLTVRPEQGHSPRRIVLDTHARTPLKSRVTSDEFAHLTTIVIARTALTRRVQSLAKHVQVLRAPLALGRIDLRWLMKWLGGRGVTNLLVEGGGEVNGSLLDGRLAHRICFFYAPKILGGRSARKAVAGEGAQTLADLRQLRDLEWRRVGPDLMLAARIVD